MVLPPPIVYDRGSISGTIGLATGHATWWLWYHLSYDLPSCDQSRPVPTLQSVVRPVFSLGRDQYIWDTFLDSSLVTTRTQVLRHPIRQHCRGCWTHTTQNIKTSVGSTADAGPATAGCWWQQSYFIDGENSEERKEDTISVCVPGSVDVWFIIIHNPNLQLWLWFCYDLSSTNLWLLSWHDDLH